MTRSPLTPVGPVEGRWFTYVDGELIAFAQEALGDMTTPHAPGTFEQAAKQGWTPAELDADDRGRVLVDLARAGHVVSMDRPSWEREGVRRFGTAKKDWVFRCSACGTETRIEEFLDIDQEGSAGVSCIGRALVKAGKIESFDAIGHYGDKQPCDWTTGGLLGTLNGGGIILELGSAGGTDVIAFPFGDPKTAAEEPDSEPAGG